MECTNKIRFSDNFKIILPPTPPASFYIVGRGPTARGVLEVQRAKPMSFLDLPCLIHIHKLIFIMQFGKLEKSTQIRLRCGGVLTIYCDLGYNSELDIVKLDIVKIRHSTIRHSTIRHCKIRHILNSLDTRFNMFKI